jgi:hypothetical protein
MEKIHSNIALNLMADAGSVLRPLIQQYGKYLDENEFKRLNDQFEDGLITGPDMINKMHDILNPCPE